MKGCSTAFRMKFDDQRAVFNKRNSQPDVKIQLRYIKIIFFRSWVYAFGTGRVLA